MENLEKIKEIEKKWQEIWKEKKIFEPEVDKTKKKYFITVPYPYINGLPHLGHGFTFSRGEFLARYKRMKGFNVLWPQAWHATGAPIVGAALQIKEKNQKWMETLREYGISEDEIPKFENPEYWVFYFTKRFRKAYEKIGFSIDWRREFFTTYLNKLYSKFIEWQYRKLKEKGLITRGKHPVVWDPKVKKVIGDHDRPDDYVGISPTEVVLIKFIDSDGKIYPCATFRPETVYGVTNIWVKENGDYVEVEIDGENWIISKEVVEEFKDQEHDVKILREIKGKELVGNFVKNPVIGNKVPILPAEFVNMEIGTGIVMSVPAHAPYDWIALEDLKKDEKWKEVAQKLKPISLIKLEGYSEFPAKDACEKYRVKSQKDKEKLDLATQEIYNKEFYNGVLKPMFGKYAGKKVFEVKEMLIEEFLERNIAIKHYILPVRFVSRYGGKVHVKIISNQWFIRYSDKKWKELAHKCVERMKIIPSEIKQVLHQNIDWIKDWAFTHQKELGTILPWDKDWTIESLSDSTIYMAYYVIAKFTEHPEIFGIDVNKIDDEFFDYTLLGRGDPEEIEKRLNVDTEVLKKIREEFEYWYPVDMRLSAKDLLWNHLIFFIFHHVAIFPEEKWPKGIAINGYVMIDGEKMSKSKGNVIPIESAVDELSADILRFILAYAGNSGMDDANIEISKAEEVKSSLINWLVFSFENFERGRKEKMLIDEWFETSMNKVLREVEDEYEKLNFKNVLVKGFYNLQNLFKWYKRRTNGNFHSDTISKFIEIQTLILYPITPHICSEILERIKGRDYALRPKWPEIGEINEKIIKTERFVQTVLEDINHIKRILKKEKNERIKLILPSSWKYEVFRRAKEMLETGEKLNDLVKIVKELKDKRVIKIVQKIIKDPGLLKVYIAKDEEEKALREAKDFIEREFSCKVEIESEEESSEEKAKFSLPGKPAIIIL